MERVHNILLDLQPKCPTDEFKVPVQIEMRGDKSVFIWVGNASHAASFTSLVVAHPTGVATVAKSNNSTMSMEAALSAARRLSKKYQRPIFLSYPVEPVSASEEGTFRLLEVALRSELENMLNNAETVERL